MKRGGSGEAQPRRALQAVLRGCLAVAAAGLLVFTLSGHPKSGLALAAGLVIGSFNGHLALKSLTSDGSFRLASMLRLGALSAAGVGIGLLLGTDAVYLTIAGLGAAQMILAAAAAYEVAR